MGHLDQPFCLAAERAGHIHAAGIAEPAIKNDGHVDIQDIAVFQPLVARNPVAHHMVDRNARGMLIATIADGGRGRARAFNMRLDTVIQFTRGHAGGNMFGDHVQHLGCQPASRAHPRKIGGFIELDAVLGQTTGG